MYKAKKFIATVLVFCVLFSSFVATPVAYAQTGNIIDDVLRLNEIEETIQNPGPVPQIEPMSIETYGNIPGFNLKNPTHAGAMGLAAVVWFYLNACAYFNFVDDTHVEQNYQKIINDNWDTISIFYQDLPEKYQAQLAVIQGDFTKEEIESAFPNLSPTDLSNAMIATIDTAIAGLKTTVYKIVGSIMSVIPQGKPSTAFKPPASDSYRYFNLTHKYGDGFKLPGGTMEGFYPSSITPSMRYDALLRQYNYGWECVDFIVQYGFPATTGMMYLELTYLTKLSPNQMYDGKVHISTTTCTKSEYKVKLRLVSNGKETIVYNNSIHETTYKAEIPKIFSLLETHCGFYPNTPVEMFGWIDFSPFPTKLAVRRTADGSNFAPYVDSYSPYLTNDGREYYKAYQPILTNTDIKSFRPDMGYTPPVFDRDIVSGGLTTPNIDKGEIVVPPGIEPLPNPMEGIEIPNPNPDVPEGFFEAIFHFIEKVLDFIYNFFTNLLNTIINALKTVFVPSENYFSTKIASLENLLAAKANYSDIEQLENELIFSENRPRFTITIYGQTIEIIDLEYFARYRNLIHNLIIGVVMVLLILFNAKMIQWIVRGSHYYQSSHNSHSSGGGRKGR